MIWLLIVDLEIRMTVHIKAIHCVYFVMKDIWIMMNCIDIYARSISSATSVILKAPVNFISKLFMFYLFYTTAKNCSHIMV